MVRITTLFIIFFVSMNIFAGVMIDTGTAATLGIDDSVQQNEDVNQAIENQKDGGIDTGAGTGSTLFSMYNAVLTGFVGLAEKVLPALALLNHAGVPGWITGTFFGGMFGIVLTIDGLSYVRGYDL
jgi:hypothetical protein